MANGGLGNGVSREELSGALKEMGEVEALVMPPHKPYAFVTYRCSWDIEGTVHSSNLFDAFRKIVSKLLLSLCF